MTLHYVTRGKIIMNRVTMLICIIQCNKVKYYIILYKLFHSTQLSTYVTSIHALEFPEILEDMFSHYDCMDITLSQQSSVCMVEKLYHCVKELKSTHTSLIS